jgi:hypothetical protein
MARHVKQPEGYTAMGLDQQLADSKAAFLRAAPAGRAALSVAKLEELRASFALEAAAGVGTVASDFRLPAALFRNVQAGGNNP